MYIPRGVAHAFLSLTEGATILYKADNAYYPEYECGVIWNDPDLDIKWPLENPLLTEKDRHWPKLREAKLFE
jgi:dTDP-4-dehydrorhamnose 3,5-epimerase